MRLGPGSHRHRAGTSRARKRGILAAATQILLLIVAITAGASDLRRRRIPNWLTVSGATLGLLLNLALHGPAGAKSSLLGLGLGLLIYFPLFLLRAMGAGDAKLVAALGAIVGPAHGLRLIVLGILISAAAGLILVITKAKLATTFRNMGRIVTELIHLRPPYAREEDLDISAQGALTLPHGTALAVGTVLYLVLLRLY